MRREGFWGVNFADIKGSSQLLNLNHLRDRDEMLLRAILCGGVSQEGRCSLSFLRGKGWRWSFILGMFLSSPSTRAARGTECEIGGTF